MPPLAQNFGSWFAALVVLAVAGAFQPLALAIEQRAGGPPRPSRRRLTALAVALALCALLPLRYDTRALAFIPPMLGMLAAAWLLAAMPPGERRRRLWSSLRAVFVLLVLLGWLYSIGVITAAEALRRLPPVEVIAVTLQQQDRPAERAEIKDPAELAAVLDGLSMIVPYQPEGEAFTNGYGMVVQTRQGSVSAEAFRGRAGKPDTCVLRLSRRGFGMGTYESDLLYAALSSTVRLPAWYPEDDPGRPNAPGAPNPNKPPQRPQW